jgi:hypothetical protein
VSGLEKKPGWRERITAKREQRKQRAVERALHKQDVPRSAYEYMGERGVHVSHKPWPGRRD